MTKLKTSELKRKAAFALTSVSGGSIKRDGTSGKLLEVRTDRATFRSSAASEMSVANASSKRSAALKRLANR